MFCVRSDDIYLAGGMGARRPATHFAGTVGKVGSTTRSIIVLRGREMVLRDRSGLRVDLLVLRDRGAFGSIYWSFGIVVAFVSIYRSFGIVEAFGSFWSFGIVVPVGM